MDFKTAPVNLIGDEMKGIERVERRLEDLAGAFYQTGNTIMSEKLTDLAIQLEACRKGTMNIANQWFARECKATDQATANMLGAAFAVVRERMSARAEAGYRVQTPADPTGGSPPIESDPRQKHCDKHRVILRPDEVCHDCYEEGRDPHA